MITVPVNYTDANAECAKYGWSLLDFTVARTTSLAQVADACSTSFSNVGAINSYNGVISPCPYILTYYLHPYAPIAMVGTPVTDSWCDRFFGMPVFCQEQCPFVVSNSGLEVGEVSLTTDLAFSTATLFTPSTTVVVSESCTETVFVTQM